MSKRHIQWPACHAVCVWWQTQTSRTQPGKFCRICWLAGHDPSTSVGMAFCLITICPRANEGLSLLWKEEGWEKESGERRAKKRRLPRLMHGAWMPKLLKKLQQRLVVIGFCMFGGRRGLGSCGLTSDGGRLVCSSPLIIASFIQ